MLDIWSIGCVIFILLTHRMAFKERNGHRGLLEQQKMGVHWPHHITDKISDLAKEFVETMLCYNWLERPFADDLLRHEFIDGNLATRRMSTSDPGLYGRRASTTKSQEQSKTSNG
jgi:serine/threonine protein kinase